MEPQGKTTSELLETTASQARLIDELQTRLAAAEEAIAELSRTADSQRELIARLRKMLFGRKSEKVVADPAQLLPGMQAYLAEGAAGDGGAEAGNVHVEAHERKARAGQPAAGWNGFPEELERVEEIVDVPESEREGLVYMGDEISERLCHRSGYFVKVIRRRKYAERNAPGFGVLVAPPPPVPSCLSLDTERCHYDVSVVVHVIAAKLVDHIPFYRQSTMFARIGVSFGRSAMCDYFAKVSRALGPLYQVLVTEILICEILNADETRVEMLDPNTGKTRTCWIWVRRTGVGPPLTAFHFSLDRSRRTAILLLGDYWGTILSDGYVVYDDLPAEGAACWAHARRKFVDAQDNHPELASRALGLVRVLYRNERTAQEIAMGKSGETALFKERRRVRTLSAPVVDQYFALCREILEKEPPSSAIARAAAYSTGLEDRLRRFISNPKLNIDNNPCENVIRPFCLGRKNWLFVGGRDGGESMAVLASFAATCKDNGVNFEEWLADVLLKLDKCSHSELKTLLPHNWKSRR